MRRPNIEQNQNLINLILKRHMASKPTYVSERELSNIMHESIILGDIDSVRSILFINPSIPQKRNIYNMPRRSDNDTFLHTAVQNLKPDIVSVLLDYHNESDPNSVNSFGYTAFSLARIIQSDMKKRICPSSDIELIKIEKIIEILKPSEAIQKQFKRPKIQSL